MTLLYPWAIGIGSVLLGLMVLWHILRPKSDIRIISSTHVQMY